MAKTTLVATPSLSDTIQAGKDWLRNMVYAGGARCPLCEQHAKVYKRTINSGQAQSLIRIHRMVGQGWIHVSLIGAKSREEGKLAYWGLLEEQIGSGHHGGRAGYWRLTQLGEQFVKGQAFVAKYALVYNGRCLGFEGGAISIQDALGKDFDYNELMRS